MLIAYAVFFSFGWLLFVRRDLVPLFGRHPWRHLSVGLVMSAAYLASVLRPPFANPTPAHILAVMVGGIATWLLVYGVIGLFVRYAQHPSPMQRYTADASYWMYLIHLPVINGRRFARGLPRVEPVRATGQVGTSKVSRSTFRRSARRWLT